MATNFKEAYQELIKYLYNNVEDQDIYDNWISFQLRELTELIEKLESQSLKFEKHYVKPCKDSEFNGINCLEKKKINQFWTYIIGMIIGCIITVIYNSMDYFQYLFCSIIIMIGIFLLIHNINELYIIKKRKV